MCWGVYSVDCRWYGGYIRHNAVLTAPFVSKKERRMVPDQARCAGRAQESQVLELSLGHSTWRTWQLGKRANEVNKAFSADLCADLGTPRKLRGQHETLVKWAK